MRIIHHDPSVLEMNNIIRALPSHTADLLIQLRENRLDLIALNHATVWPCLHERLAASLSCIKNTAMHTLIHKCKGLICIELRQSVEFTVDSVQEVIECSTA